MSASRRHARTASVVLASFFFATIAQADPIAPTPGDSARAQTLFDEAVKLLEQKDFAAACPKLADSFALEPAGGTALDLAFCYESDDQLASAITAYRSALRVAESDHRDDRQIAAKKKIEALEAKVGHLHLVASEATWRAEGWSVLLDTKLLSPESAGALLPLDAGNHVLTITALGKRVYARGVSMSDGIVSELTIEHLDDAPAGVPSPVLAKPIRANDSAASFVFRDDVPRRTWGIAAGGAGIVGLGVGTVAGIVAANLHAKSDRLCPATGCVEDGADAEKQADRAAWVSNIGFIAGTALIGVGTYLFLSARHAKRVPVITDAMLGRFTFDLQ